MSHDTSRTGVIDWPRDGVAYLRDPARHWRCHPADPMVPPALLRHHDLRPGTIVSGPVSDGPRPALQAVVTIEGRGLVDQPERRDFADLTAIDPHRRIRLETGPTPLTMRVLDLLTPIGKGQRGLLVAPPRTGKTVLLQQVAAALTANHPEVALIVLLVDERPEEVTEIRRSVQGLVIASSSDQSIEEHVRLAELTVARAQRLAEAGTDVFLLVDSLTRLARAYNKQTATGRTMTGGVDIKALEVPKRLFGAAREFEEGGSLTVLATCLIETGSRMDDLIFQEFQGTGNMEAVLDRRLADRRVYPALDISRSGTRKEEKLLGPETTQRMALVRRTLADLKPVEAMEAFLKQLGKSPSNAEFLEDLGKKSAPR